MTGDFNIMYKRIQHTLRVQTLEKATDNNEEKKEKRYNPLIQNDCVEALFASYTSKAGECQFFSDSAESKCLLDPYSRRSWNCEGRSFINGYRCEYISEAFNSTSSAKEVNSLISLIGQNGEDIIGNLGWSIMSQEEVAAVSGVKKEETAFMVSVLKLLKLVSEKNQKLQLTELGRKVHDYLLVQKYFL